MKHEKDIIYSGLDTFDVVFLVFETLCYVRIKETHWHRLSVTFTNVEATFRGMKHMLHDLGL